MPYFKDAEDVYANLGRLLEDIIADDGGMPHAPRWYSADMAGNLMNVPLFQAPPEAYRPRGLAGIERGDPLGAHGAHDLDAVPAQPLGVVVGPGIAEADRPVERERRSDRGGTVP